MLLYSINYNNKHFYPHPQPSSSSSFFVIIKRLSSRERCREREKKTHYVQLKLCTIVVNQVKLVIYFDLNIKKALHRHTINKICFFLNKTRHNNDNIQEAPSMEGKPVPFLYFHEYTHLYPELYKYNKYIIYTKTFCKKQHIFWSLVEKR